MADEQESVRKGSAKIMKYMSKKPGQNLADVSAEMKELTDEDVQQLVQGIEDGSLTY